MGKAKRFVSKVGLQVAGAAARGNELLVVRARLKSSSTVDALDADLRVTLDTYAAIESHMVDGEIWREAVPFEHFWIRGPDAELVEARLEVLIKHFFEPLSHRRLTPRFLTVEGDGAFTDVLFGEAIFAPQDQGGPVGEVTVSRHHPAMPGAAGTMESYLVGGGGATSPCWHVGQTAFAFALGKRALRLFPFGVEIEDLDPMLVCVTPPDGSGNAGLKCFPLAGIPDEDGATSLTATSNALRRSMVATKRHKGVTYEATVVPQQAKRVGNLKVTIEPDTRPSRLRPTPGPGSANLAIMALCLPQIDARRSRIESIMIHATESGQLPGSALAPVHSSIHLVRPANLWGSATPEIVRFAGGPRQPLGKLRMPARLDPELGLALLSFRNLPPVLRDAEGWNTTPEARAAKERHNFLVRTASRLDRPESVQPLGYIPIRLTTGSLANELKGSSKRSFRRGMRMALRSGDPSVLDGDETVETVYLDWLDDAVRVELRDERGDTNDIGLAEWYATAETAPLGGLGTTDTKVVLDRGGRVHPASTLHPALDDGDYVVLWPFVLRLDFPWLNDPEAR